MDFNNQQVKQRVVQHILFAIQSVNSVFPVADKVEDLDKENRFLEQIAHQLRNPIIMQILNFTLNLDYELKNSLGGYYPVLEGVEHGLLSKD